jgi:hypothetical protein
MSRHSSILEGIIKPHRGGLSAEHANYVLSLGFSPKQQARYAKLAAKAQVGSLTAKEQLLLDDFLNANALLIVLQSKARVSLRKRPSAA